MRIVADERMNGLQELIGPLGELVTAPGREIGPQLLADAEVLLVRSITPVSAALLADSPVHFVGSATSGLDHVDRPYLEARGIALADARGSNANAVVDYVLAALASLISAGKLDVSRLSVGIVGQGQVGSRLQSRLAALGITTRVCDPPLAARLRANGFSESAAPLVSLPEALECSVVSLHVPLQHDGDFPTALLLSRPLLAAMGPGKVLINTSRGGVVDEAGWLDLHRQGKAPLLVSDVWCHEPAVNAKLVSAATLATPHIAGYSEHAKRQATIMLAKALQQFQAGNYAGPVADLGKQGIAPPSAAGHFTHIDCWRQLTKALPLQALSARFKQAVAEADREGLAARHFDGFRNDLRSRQEFSELQLSEFLSGAERAGQVEFFRAAGFMQD